MSIESLKAQARRHEQKEEWQKALDQYGLAIKAFADDDQPDIGLFNRVGDLNVRVGNYAKALEHYEKAVELYREAALHNNAIAICKKIVRHVPARSQVYLTMGQIRAEQGFLPDARTNFLTYAERMQEEGNLDESFRALVEFCDLAPEDVDLRITVAEQMAASGRPEDALAQLGVAYRFFKRAEQDDRAFGLERRILELDPEADFDALAREDSADEGADYAMAYGEVDLSEADTLVEEEEEAPVEDEEDAAASRDAQEESGGEDVWHEAAEEAEDEDEDAGFELPIMEGTSDWDEDEEDGADLPFIELDAEEDEGLIEPDLGASTEAERAPAPAPTPPQPAEEEREPDEVSLESADHSLEPIDHSPQPADHSPQSAEESTQPASEYVDLGSMIFGDDPPEPKTTRFRVAYEEPSGDEAADFQKMLTQFKEKVSENVEAGDVRAHYDLGTAYKEMGLLDEAISEFQAALRASADHLPTYELMGQTFMEMGKHEAAVKSLERALRSRDTVEDELVGIYYYLARAYEQLGRTDSAVEFYDRVFSLDINFADVTERLRALR